MATTQAQVEQQAKRGYLTDAEMNQALDDGVCVMTRQTKRQQAHIPNGKGFQYDWDTQTWVILSRYNGR